MGYDVNSLIEIGYLDKHKLEAEIASKETTYADFNSVTKYSLRVQRFDSTWTELYSRGIFTLGESGNGVAVLPYDPVKNTVTLIEQFRLPALIQNRKSAWLLESVAGLIGRDENPDDTALRETEEEVGLTPYKIEKIGEMFASPGSCNEIVHCYIAIVKTKDSGDIQGLDHEQENIRVHVVPFETALALSDSGCIEDMKTQFLLNWLARNIARWMPS